MRAGRTGEEERGVRDDLVELDVRVEGTVEVEDGLAQTGDDVAAHGQQQQREREGHACRRAAGDADAVPGDAAQALVLVLHRVRCSAR